MAELTYLDFDLAIRKSPSGAYRIEIRSPGGEPSADFLPPFSAAELERLQAIVVGPSREVERPGRAARMADLDARMKLFGERLYEAVFPADVRAALSNSLLLAQQKSAGVRIRLHLDEAPELAQLPWEYLYDRADQSYLALSELTPIVRHLRLKGPPSAQLLRPPIQILVMSASPLDYTDVNAEEEWARLVGSLKELVAAKLVELTRVPRATLSELRKSLQKRSYHVFHFIGHGGFDPATSAPVLVFEEGGKGVMTTRDELKTALSGHMTLRLVVLSSCDGARTDGQDPFAGMAQGLVQAKIPAVIAMQFKITNPAAVSFTEGLYGAITNNLPIDNALAEARKAVRDKNPTEWGTPVLFLRGEDGRLFLIDRPTEDQLRELQIKALADDARAAIDARQYALAIEKLHEIVKLQGGALPAP